VLVGKLTEARVLKVFGTEAGIRLASRVVLMAVVRWRGAMKISRFEFHENQTKLDQHRPAVITVSQARNATANQSTHDNILIGRFNVVYSQRPRSHSPC
jgi:hypothetical protein